MTAKQSDSAFYQEWSATLVRTRIEMFTAAVVFLAFAAWPVRLAHLPFVGLDIDGRIARWEVLLPLLMFYSYAAISFYVRSKVENDRLIDPAAQVQRALSQVNEFTSELRGVDLGSQVPTFLQALDGLKIRATLEGENPRNAFNNRLESFTEALRAIRSRPDTTNRYVMRLARMLREFPSGAAKEAGDELLGAFEAASSKLTSIRDELLSLQADLARGHREFDELAQKTAGELSELRDQLVELQTRQGTALTQALEDSNEQMKGIRRELARVATFEMFERTVLSFWIPLVGSMSAVALGICLAGAALLPWVHPWALGIVWR